MTRELRDIVKGVLGNVLYALLAALWAFFYAVILGANVAALLLFLASMVLLGALAFYSNRILSRMALINGRHDAMSANVRLLRRHPPRDPNRRYIYSTRVTFWPAGEAEPARTEFRKELTRLVQAGGPIKRLWQIRSAEDVVALERYLRLYAQAPNLSMRVFQGETPLPEILVVYGKVASVSIPQKANPERLHTAFHFFSKRAVRRWEDYFLILWESGTKLKSGTHIDEQLLAKLKKEYGFQ